VSAIEVFPILIIRPARSIVVAEEIEREKKKGNKEGLYVVLIEL
jgi:hypothetical protein